MATVVTGTHLAFSWLTLTLPLCIRVSIKVASDVCKWVRVRIVVTFALQIK